MTRRERSGGPPENLLGETHVLGRRAVAHLLDLALSIGLPVVIAIHWLGDLAPGSWLASAEGTWVWLIAVWGGNWVVAQGLTGFSAGKVVAGVRVVDEAGRPPGLRRALLRTLPLAFEQLGLVGLWAAGRSPTRQRLGDRWAHTYVIRSWASRATVGATSLGLLTITFVFAYGFR